MEHILEELQPHAIYPLEAFGINMSITKPVILMFVAAFVVFFFFWTASRKPQLVPKGIQNVAESIIDFVNEGLVLEIMGEKGRPYFGVIATFFMFILTVNIMGLIPTMLPATSQTGTTGAWALIVFILYNVVGLAKHGPYGYLKTFVPPGTPGPLVPFMFILEIISHLARPISLAVRLFANIAAGHLVIGVFALLTVTSPIWLKVLPFSMVVLMYLFEVLVAALQAYIFAILAAIYIGTALSEEH